MLQYWPSLWIGAASLLCCYYVCALNHFNGEDGNVLHIGGIFPIGGADGWQGGQACMPAAKMALEDVNRRKDLLPGYVLKLHSNDSQVIKKKTRSLLIVHLTWWVVWKELLLTLFKSEWMLREDNGWWKGRFAAAEIKRV